MKSAQAGIFLYVLATFCCGVLLCCDSNGEKEFVKSVSSSSVIPELSSVNLPESAPDTVVVADSLAEDSLSSSLDSVFSSSLEITAMSSSISQTLSSSSKRKKVSSSSSVNVSSSSEIPQDTLAVDSLPEEKSLCADAPEGTVCDERDGFIYHRVVIGHQVWLKENLNFDAPLSWCYDGKASNCTKFGRLYQWTSALGLDSKYSSVSAAGVIGRRHRGVCPEGFRIPTSDDMKTLVETVVRSNENDGVNDEGVGTSLKSSGLWSTSEEAPLGSDRYGFSANPAGYRNARGKSLYAGKETSFWIAEESNSPTHAPYWNLYYGNSDFLGGYNNLKTVAYSVRCLKD